MAKPPNDTRHHTIAGQEAAHANVRFLPQQKNTFRFATPQAAWLGFMALHGIIGAESREEAVAPALLAAHQRILGILDEAYRGRRLLIDHLRVLRFYGLKGRPPRLWVPREARAYTLWEQGLEVLGPALVKAGYVADAFSIRWQEEMARQHGAMGPGEKNGPRPGRGDMCPDEVR